ncbi:MAG: hypothetical protein JNK74_03835 [Candidatus Hydrogenedentes bacterium]|nr:hypothetical protein [Candidatus Hydrogenedentota bacterium]
MALALLASVAGGVALVRHLATSGFPWQTRLSWKQMEGLTGAQAIASTKLEVELDPESGRLEGKATLAVTAPGGDGSQVILLLNQALDVDELTFEGQSLSSRRNGERLLVQLPPEATAGRLQVAYSGVLESGNSSTLLATPGEFVVDRLQFWYPVDLNSFSTLAVAATVPEDFEVVWSGALLDNQVREGRRTVRWEESRPVLAAGFAAGRYQKISRVQGSIRCNIYGREVDAARAEAWLADLGDSYNYFHTQLGPDGFNQLNLVLSDSIDGAAHLGGSTLLCNPARLQNGDASFVLIAHHVARNWWGETVSGRWFSSRPEAGEWLMTSLSEYSAWQALRTLKGRRAYLRHQESLYCPPEIPGPMKAYNLERHLLPADGLDERLFTVRGPYTAAMLAEYIGADAFARACRNFMSVHRYSTVSYAALLHEMTLASEKPLDELVRVWFDRPGALDYAIAGVTQEGGRVHVTVENVGDIPAYVPMELGLVMEDGYQVQTIEPGMHGDTVSFTLNGPLKRIVLDPEFAVADMRRTNNAWPSTQWPLALNVSSSGRIALVSQSEWGGDRSHRLYLFPLAGRTPEGAIELAGSMPLDLAWDSAGQQLAVQRRDSAGLWRDNQWHPIEGSDTVFLGWSKAGPLVWRAGRIDIVGATSLKEGELLPRPRAGNADLQADTERLAYLTDEGVLVTWEADTNTIKIVQEVARPSGGLRWRGGSNEIIYFEESGGLVSVTPDSPAVTTLLHRNYPIAQARISENGGRVAWVDPAGLLRGMTPGESEPVYISLPGEVIDFAWEGEDALIAIAAAIPRRLPMRFHADYTLWRIPVTTWKGLQLPYDPHAFAEAADTVPLQNLP